MFSLEQTAVNGGSLTSAGGVLCLDQSSNKWIMRTGNGPKNCKDSEDCLEVLNRQCHESQEIENTVAPTLSAITEAEEKGSDIEEEDEGSTITQNMLTTNRENKTTMRENNNTAMRERQGMAMIDNKTKMTEKQETFIQKSKQFPDGG